MGHSRGESMESDRLFLLDGLPVPVRDRYWQQATAQPFSYDKGETIYDSALARPALALVLEGRVRVLHGRVVMNTLCAGDVFGVAALFGQAEPYASRVVADTACRVAFIPQETVSAWMAAEPRIAENYVRFLSDRIRFLNRRLATLTARQTDGKLWRFLLAYKGEDDIVHLPGGMTELAERLNMGRSSLYRSLDALTAAGRIERHGKNIRIIQEDE